MLNFKRIAPSVLALGLLAACGGGGDGTPATQYVSGTTEVPVGVETQVGDVIVFSKAQIAASSDSAEPVVLADTVLATSDTDEPAEI
jgi:hypothetical protein